MFCIRKLKENDKEELKQMMKVFYASPAVLTNGSEEIFNEDIDNCLNDSPYLDCFVFEDNGLILGYSMIAKSFSTEFGKPCIWVEDLYIKEEHRGKGIGTKFFNFLENRYKNCVLRLEVEEENRGAIKVYKKCGFDFLAYMEMKKILN